MLILAACKLNLEATGHGKIFWAAKDRAQLPCLIDDPFTSAHPEM